MKTTSAMKRVMIFIDETDRFGDKQLAAALVERMRKEGIAGATVLHGTTGFGSHKQIHSTALLDLAVSLPQIVIVMDTAEKIQAIMPVLEEMIREGLVVVDDVEATKFSPR